MPKGLILTNLHYAKLIYIYIYIISHANVEGPTTEWIISSLMYSPPAGGIDPTIVMKTLTYKRQELLTLRAHLGSPPNFGGIHVANLLSFLCCIFVCSFCVLLTQSCQSLWILYTWLPLSLFSNFYLLLIDSYLLFGYIKVILVQLIISLVIHSTDSLTLFVCPCL